MRWDTNAPRQVNEALRQAAASPEIRAVEAGLLTEDLGRQILWRFAARALLVRAGSDDPADATGAGPTPGQVQHALRTQRLLEAFEAAIETTEFGRS